MTPMPLLEAYPLLDRAQNKPDVEEILRQIRKGRLDEQKDIFIPPQAKASIQAPDDAHFPLVESIADFLEGEEDKVFLLLGDSGAGKSTFTKALERGLWKVYEKKDGLIPLHISLPAIDKPDQDMVTKHLRRLDFTDAQIKELKDHRKLILICDGYDESQQTKNLYMANRLNQPDEWQAKMVISCRSEYLGADYRDRFQPGDRNQFSKSTQFQEAVLVPFSASQVDDYIDQYVSLRQPLWRAKEYKQALNSIPSLKALVRNPFLMSLSLEVLPRMMDPGEQLSIARFTKVLLYDQFIEQWLERGKRRLGEKELNPLARAAFESLSDEGFAVNGIDFLKKLSVGIYKEQDGHPVIEYSRFQDEGSWKTAFFSRDDDTYLLREACPLTKNGNQYRFIHRSMLEYGLARAIFDPQEYKSATLQPSMIRRASTGSIWSFEVDCNLEIAASNDHQEPNSNSPLAWRSLVNEPSILQFLEERAQQEPVFKQQLFEYIEYSKLDKKWRTAAGNAITILIRAGVEFRFAELQGIRIPGADLSYGMFQSADLQGADLRKTNLRNVWFHGADLSRSRMTGVQFGELPFLKYDCGVTSCMYSPDGSSFAVGLFDGTINLHATSNWERLWMSKDHVKAVGSVAYSPNGDRIVSGSNDSTVRLWDAATGLCHHVYADHKARVYNVAYSPYGDSVASSSYDRTVRLWDVETGACLHVLSGHNGVVYAVVYSPEGDSIASCSQDYTIRLWDVATGECNYILSGHKNEVGSIAYAPEGDLLASAGMDTKARIWEVETGECRYVLTGHTSGIECVLFSPKGNQLASGDQEGRLRLWDVESGTCIHTLSCGQIRVNSISYSPQGDQVAARSHNNTVTLWDPETGECCHTLTGHNNVLERIVHSPKGDQVASASKDGTVRLWSVRAGTSRLVSSDHKGGVLSVLYSSKTHRITSSSRDKTIRLWDAQTGASIRTLTGHTDSISAFAYSRQEDQIVSCSFDKTVRLWDVESGVCRRILKGHRMWVCDVDFSPRGGQVASASYDGTVRLWNTETGECLHILKGHNQGVHIAAYSPPGDQVASGSFDGTVRLWNVDTGACHYTLVGHTERITSIAYSPEGNQIASASWDGSVRLWNVESGVCNHTLCHGDKSYISEVVFSVQGNQLVSADRAGILKIWDAETGDCRHIMIGYKKYIDTIALSPRGNLILSTSDDGEVRLLDTETGDCYWTLNLESLPTSDQQLKTNGVAWITSDIDTFVTGGRDGSVRVWEVREEGGQHRVRMRWRSTNGQLSLEDACVQDVVGLSHLNHQLLRQRGAVGEPCEL